MSEPFVAEIKIWAGNFAPRGWAFCNGQLLPISQNTALFSLIGTIYGGDGRTTTGLPDFQGRAPMHPGLGPGLTDRRLGQEGGVEIVTLSEAQTPSHNHTMNATANPAEAPGPGLSGGNALGRSVGGAYYATNTNPTPFNSSTMQNTGGGQGHNNLQPFLGISFIIALQGLYPSRN